MSTIMTPTEIIERDTQRRAELLQRRLRALRVQLATQNMRKVCKVRKVCNACTASSSSTTLGAKS